MDKLTLQTKLGAAVRERRQALRIHIQDTFADAIGMHRAYYGALERGERNVTLATFARVEERLDMPISELMAEAKHKLCR